MRFLVAALALAAASSAQADEFRFGIMGAYAQLSTEDPNGRTEDASKGIPSLIGTFEWDRNSRVFGQLYQYKYKLTSSTTQIGQKVERTGANISLQQQFRVARAFRPWLGLGLGFSEDSFSGRHTIDQDGFLAATFPNRSESSFNGIINAAVDWAVSDRWNVGGVVQYETPFGDGGVEALVVGVTLTF